MITSSENILKIGRSLIVNETIYLPVIDKEVATRCSSRLNCKTRYGKNMEGMIFSCRVVLAIETPTVHNLLLKITRLS
jgi:hypothetical protein